MVAYGKSGVYIFGGNTYNSEQSEIVYASSDLWKFNNETGWAYWAGRTEQTYDQQGEMRVPSSDTIIHSKSSGTMFLDDDENLWFFSGVGEFHAATGMV